MALRVSPGHVGVGVVVARRGAHVAVPGNDGPAVVAGGVRQGRLRHRRDMALEIDRGAVNECRLRTLVGQPRVDEMSLWQLFLVRGGRGAQVVSHAIVTISRRG